MKKRSLKENSVVILFILIRDFFVSLFLSFVLFIKVIIGRKAPPLRENRFLDSMNFIFHIGPKSFWGAPSGMKIGRSIATFLHYIFRKDTVFTEKKKGLGKSGFTLIEMLLSITIFSIIIIMAFDVMGNIGILRTKLSSKLDMNSELYTAVEKLTGLIKTGGDIDYEEYWNRLAVGTTTASGHYDVFSGYGNYGSGGNVATNNYGDGLYYCRSTTTSMGTGGCLSNIFNTYGGAIPVGTPQRYGQYTPQFVDFNSNATVDGGTFGDENGDGNLRGDDDDETIGVGPSAFTGGTGLKELYLIKKGPQTERIFFRWTLKPDPYAPPSTVCTLSGAAMGSGCLGNIQILRLVGRDLGLSHTGTAVVTSTGRYDGLIDTWECREDFACNGSNKLPNGTAGEWADIFPDYINVKSIDFYPYPDKDFRLAWKEDNTAVLINPYVRMNITLGLAWEKRRQIKGPSGEVSITTTINLSR